MKARVKARVKGASKDMPLIDFNSLVNRIVAKAYPSVGTTYYTNFEAYFSEDLTPTGPPIVDDETGRRFFVWGISVWEEDESGEAHIVAP